MGPPGNSLTFAEAMPKAVEAGFVGLVKLIQTVIAVGHAFMGLGKIMGDIGVLAMNPFAKSPRTSLAIDTQGIVDQFKEDMHLEGSDNALADIKRKKGKSDRKPGA